jgi:hypothetical protein
MQSLQTFLCLAMLFLGIGFPQTQSRSLDLTFPCATFLYFSIRSCFHIAACKLHRRKQEQSVCSVGFQHVLNLINQHHKQQNFANFSLLFTIWHQYTRELL